MNGPSFLFPEGCKEKVKEGGRERKGKETESPKLNVEVQGHYQPWFLVKEMRFRLDFSRHREKKVGESLCVPRNVRCVTKEDSFTIH